MTPDLEHAADRAPRRSVQREVGVLGRGHGGGDGDGASYVHPHWGQTVTPGAINAPQAKHWASVSLAVDLQITNVSHSWQRKPAPCSMTTRSLAGARKNK